MDILRNICPGSLSRRTTARLFYRYVSDTTLDEVFRVEVGQTVVERGRVVSGQLVTLLYGLSRRTVKSMKKFSKIQNEISFSVTILIWISVWSLVCYRMSPGCRPPSSTFTVSFLGHSEFTTLPGVMLHTFKKVGFRVSGTNRSF